MDLDFTDEQEMLRETVRGVCEKHASLTVVREVEDDPIGYPDSFWTQLADLGLLGLTISEEYGGSGMTMLDARRRLRRARPRARAVAALRQLGAERGRARAGGERRATPRVAPAASRRATRSSRPRGSSPTAASARRRATAGRGRRRRVRRCRAPSGTCASPKRPTPTWCSPAPAPPISTSTSSSSRATQLVSTLTQQMSVASDTQFRVDFDAVRVPAATRIGAPVPAGRHGTRRCATASSCSRRTQWAARRYALEITVQYAKDRHQFDKPLGAFQALAHYLADAKATVDGGAHARVGSGVGARRRPRRSIGWRRWRSSSRRRRIATSTAMAQQIFGGVGFTVEYDIQLYFRRAKAAAARLVGHPLPGRARRRVRARRLSHRPGWVPSELLVERAPAVVDARPVEEGLPGQPAPDPGPDGLDVLSRFMHVSKIHTRI